MNSIKLKSMSAVRRAALLMITAAILTSCLRAHQSHVQVELLTKDISGGGKQYALRLKNNSKEPITFQTLPDRGFGHSACTPGSVFATSISHWNADSRRWEPRDTFISGLKASVKGDLVTDTFILQPSGSLCAGWWADSDNAKPGEELRMMVCTSFRANSRCFTSPSFRLPRSEKKTVR